MKVPPLAASQSIATLESRTNGVPACTHTMDNNFFHMSAIRIVTTNVWQQTTG
jgi:hypothetical protein